MISTTPGSIRFMDFISLSKIETPVSHRQIFTRQLAELCVSAEFLQKQSRQMISLARYLELVRDSENLLIVSRLLKQTRVGRDIGTYFESLALLRLTRNHDLCRPGFDALTCAQSDRAKAWAILSLGGLAYLEGNYSEAARLYHESALISLKNDPVAAVVALRMQADIADLNGDFSQALVLIEQTAPLAFMIKHTLPSAYFDFVNTHAIVLASNKRYDEALSVASISANCPFAKFNHEWQKTPLEIIQNIRQPSHSMIAVPSNYQLKRYPFRLIDGRNEQPIEQESRRSRQRMWLDTVKTLISNPSIDAPRLWLIEKIVKLNRLSNPSFNKIKKVVKSEPGPDRPE